MVALQSLAPRGLVQRYLPNPLLVKASGGEANGELWLFCSCVCVSFDVIFVDG